MNHAQVLIVDDDIKILNSLKRLLKSKDFSVEVTTPSEALILLNDFSYPVIIADYNMNEMNGIIFLTNYLWFF